MLVDEPLIGYAVGFLLNYLSLTSSQLNLTAINFNHYLLINKKKKPTFPQTLLNWGFF